MKSTKKLVLTALMLAIGLVLPPVVRMIPQGGVLFSPMHIPVFLAGLVIGPVEGIIVGILCPVLNNLMFGMPQGVSLFGMCAELPVYGLVSGLLLRLLKKRLHHEGAAVYISLITAMILGRIAGGIVQGLVLGAGYTIQTWAAAYFVSTAPAIVIHLILIPAVYFALEKAHLVQN